MKLNDWNTLNFPFSQEELIEVANAFYREQHMLPGEAVAYAISQLFVSNELTKLFGKKTIPDHHFIQKAMCDINERIVTPALENKVTAGIISPDNQLVDIDIIEKKSHLSRL